MNREHASMTLDQMHDWCRDRDVEIEAAYAKGDITLPVRMSLQEWVQDSYCEYLLAGLNGLLRMDG